jgi:hypothetical protein
VPPAEVHFPEEFEGRDNSFQVLPFNVERPIPGYSHGQEYGIVSFLKELLRVADRGIEAELHPQRQDVVNIALEDGLRKAMFRDGYAHHSSGYREGFKDCYPVAHEDQISGGGKASRPRPYYGYFLGFGARGRLRRLIRAVGVNVIYNEALEGHDSHRLIYVAAVAVALARMMAGAAANAGEGVVFFDYPQGVVVTAFTDKGNVTLRPLAGGASISAGGYPLFLHSVSIGDSLRVTLVNGFALRKPSFVIVGQRYGADPGTIAASGAPAFIHIPRPAPD